MRSIPAAVTAARNERAGIISHHLVWILAAERDTGAGVAIGFWTGDDHQDFVIDSVARTYFGAGAFLGLDAIAQETGVQVRQHQVSLSSLAPEVALALRGYDVRLAKCQIHRAEFSTLTGALLAPPVLIVDGEVDGASLPTPAEDGEAVATATVLSNAAMLTRPLTRKRSDESLRARSPNDAFLQYAKVSGAKGSPWGT